MLSLSVTRTGGALRCDGSLKPCHCAPRRRPPAAVLWTHRARPTARLLQHGSVRSTVRSVPLTVAAASCKGWATAYCRPIGGADRPAGTLVPPLPPAVSTLVSAGPTDLQVLDAFLPVAVEVVRADRLPEVRFDKAPARLSCQARHGRTARSSLSADIPASLSAECIDRQQA